MMNRSASLLLSGLSAALLFFSCQKDAPKTRELPMPPVAPKDAKILKIHDHERTDNYFWLNERENPAVIEYLEAENAYTDTVMHHTEGLQETLYEEMVGRIPQADESAPYLSNGYYYYTRYVEGGEYPVFCRKKESLESQEQVLLDVNQMAEGFDYYQVVGLSVSPDNRMLAFGVDTLSRRKYTIQFKDLRTGKILDTQIPNTTGGSTWANDNQTIFFSQKDETLRPYKVFRYRLGDKPHNAALVWHEEDNTFLTYVYKTLSGKYIVIGSHSTLSSELKLIPADRPYAPMRVFHPREANHLYSIAHHEDHFFVLTNDQARNFRLMKVGEGNTYKGNWEEVIPHREDVLLEDIDVFKGYLVLSERKDGLNQLRIHSFEDGGDHYIDFGEETYMAYPSVNREYETDWLRYAYSSLTTPNSTYDYNMKSREKVLRKQDKVLGDFDPQRYEARRLYATAGDGTRVPISLVYRKGLKPNGKNPLLLYGYGSYGNSIDASFNSSRLSLLDRGFVYAIAHIRGGQEMGRAWYEDGKLLNKKNTFTDFIDCAEYLIAEKYTDREHIFAYGGSAGGLLIGAVVNMRPDLFKGAMAAVPFVDVITTMLDESIPLTTGEYDEWGNPNEKEYYDYILSYSPYDNVEAKDYPNMLVTTGLHDSQVQYWEPAKWVAKLRELKTDHNVLLLKTEMSAGHSGASGRFERYRTTALQFAFMLDLLGKGE